MEKSKLIRHEDIIAVRESLPLPEDIIELILKKVNFSYFYNPIDDSIETYFKYLTIETYELMGCIKFLQKNYTNEELFIHLYETLSYLPIIDGIIPNIIDYDITFKDFLERFDFYCKHIIKYIFIIPEYKKSFTHYMFRTRGYIKRLKESIHIIDMVS